MRTHLTAKTFVGLLAWQLFGLLAMIFPTLWSVYLIIPVALCIVLALDFRSLPAGNAIGLKLASDRTVELGQVVEVKWRLLAGDARLFAISSWRIRLPQIPAMTFFPEQIRAKRVTNEEETSFSFCTMARADRLSRHTTATIELRVFSLLQLWGRSFSLSARDLIPGVIPMHQRVPEQTFERTMRDNRSLFMGARVRIRLGAPDQFHSHRPYRHGDPQRFVDHKKAARYGTRYTKTFDALVDQTVIIGCDLGRSMSGTIEGSEKLSYYQEAIYHLVEHALQARDRVGFFGFAGKVSLVIPPTRNLKAFTPLISGDPRMQVMQEESQYGLIPKALQTLSGRRCLFILFSDLTRPSVQLALTRSLGVVSRRHMTMVLGLVDTKFDIDEQILGVTEPGDDYRQSELLYSYWLRNQFEAFNQQAGRLGAGVVNVPERYWMDMTIRLYRALRSSVLAG